MPRNQRNNAVRAAVRAPAAPLRVDDADRTITAQLGLPPAVGAVELARPLLVHGAVGNGATAEKDPNAADACVADAVGRLHHRVVEVVLHQRIMRTLDAGRGCNLLSDHDDSRNPHLGLGLAPRAERERRLI